MTATKRLGDVPGHTAGWTLVVNGQEMPKTTEWEVRSTYGCVETAVVINAQGNPAFDRPAYSEAPNVNMVAYGRTSNGEVRVAIIRQPRPHADDPEDRTANDHAPVVFGQVPMAKILRRQHRAKQRKKRERQSCCRLRDPHVPTTTRTPHSFVLGLILCSLKSTWTVLLSCAVRIVNLYTRQSTYQFLCCCSAFEKGEMRQARCTECVRRTQCGSSSLLHFPNFGLPRYLAGAQRGGQRKLSTSYLLHLDVT
jgi:hypothetical protein